MLLAGSLLGQDVLRLFLVGSSGGGSSLTSLALAQVLTIMGLVPLAERGGVNLDDGRLDQGLGADQLVVGGVVDNVHDTGLAGHGLATPREGAGLKAHGALLDVATAAANSVDALGAQLGVGGLATQLELALFAVEGALGTGGRTLVAGITANTYNVEMVLLVMTVLHHFRGGCRVVVVWRMDGLEADGLPILF